MSGEGDIKVVPGKHVKLVFDDSNHPSIYATNITVQHTPHEFVISFYEARPPVILGSAEEREAQLQAIDHIYAHCVSRVTVAATRMEGFIKALQDNYDIYQQSLEGECGDE